MFQWLKTLKKLSTQDHLLDSMDEKISQMSLKINEFNIIIESSSKKFSSIESEVECHLDKMQNMREALNHDIQNLALKNSERARDLAEITSNMDAYTKTVQEKTVLIQETIKQHLVDVNRQVQSYEGNVSKLGDRLTELGNIIAEFQR